MTVLIGDCRTIMPDHARWADVHNVVRTTSDATARTVRKMRPPHTGQIERGFYAGEDGGPHTGEQP